MSARVNSAVYSVGSRGVMVYEKGVGESGGGVGGDCIFAGGG
jgi:hypothetical protein